jgi:hypothetical protein
MRFGIHPQTTLRTLLLRYRDMLSLLPLIMLLVNANSVRAEGGAICEVAPKAACLDASQVQDRSFDLPLDAMGVSRDGFSICDSTYSYTTAPDIILILDNTGSMARVRTVNGLPRYCDYPPDPNQYPEDPGCVSGDPDTLRAKALQAFVDSALAKGGPGTRVGVVLFSDKVWNGDQVRWTPLNSDSVAAIKAEIYAEADGSTNYYAAFKAAYDLLQTSTKPREEQTIIFVSDGRPNHPLANSGGPYLYKQQYLDKKLLPTVHSIFLGDQSINFQDLKDISTQTGGLFFAIRDVSKMAGILTDSIAKQLFKRARPSSSTVTNRTNRSSFTVPLSAHIPNGDTTAYTLHLPGPLTLSKGVNSILIRTQYSGGSSADLQFNLRRGGGEAMDTNLFALTCRPRASLSLINSQNQNLSDLGGAFGLSDNLAKVQLTTQADLDTFAISVDLKERVTARTDEEITRVPKARPTDSVMEGAIPFAHQAQQKILGNGTLDGVHRDAVIAVWRNPWLPEDTAIATAVLRYGAEVLFAAVYDVNSDGLTETVRMRLAQEMVVLPERIRLRMKSGDGAVVERVAKASTGEITFEKSDGNERHDQLRILLQEPFPKTATTTAPVESAGHFFRQDNVPLVEADFSVDDSVAPAIFLAEIKPTDRAHVLRRISVTFTEPVNFNVNSLNPFIFKRDTTFIPANSIPIDHLDFISDVSVDIYLIAGADFVPVGGDSIAIAPNGDIRDAKDRYPAKPIFTDLNGTNPSQLVHDFYVTLGGGSYNSYATHGEDPPPTGPAFIPLDSLGAALQGSDQGKCGACYAGPEGEFHGSVIHIVVPGPVRYDLTVFTNLGVFVNRFSGSIEQKDLRFLARKAEGEGEQRHNLYLQRIVWNGLSGDGRVANTGAYVIRSVFHFDRNAQTGANASKETQLKRFGFLRNCCRTADHWADFDFEPQWP